MCALLPGSRRAEHSASLTWTLTICCVVFILCQRKTIAPVSYPILRFPGSPGHTQDRLLILLQQLRANFLSPSQAFHCKIIWPTAFITRNTSRYARCRRQLINLSRATALISSCTADFLLMFARSRVHNTSRKPGLVHSGKRLLLHGAVFRPRTASFCKSAKSTISPGCNLRASNCSYTMKQSLANAMTNTPVIRATSVFSLHCHRYTVWLIGNDRMNLFHAR